MTMDSEKHFGHLMKLLEIEQAAEIARFQKAFLDKTPEERELAGKALLRLEIAEFHFSPAGHRLVTFRYADSKPLPIYSPDAGDMVTLAYDPDQVSDLPVGTVYEKNREIITVAFNYELPDWVEEKGI